MKKISKFIGFTVLTLVAIAHGASQAKADWEYVRFGIVCVGADGLADNGFDIEARLNERLYENPREVVISMTHGHKKIMAPFRIINVSVTNSESDNSLNRLRACAALEAVSP